MSLRIILTERILFVWVTYGRRVTLLSDDEIQLQGGDE
jgi:hypothetical protein